MPLASSRLLTHHSTVREIAVAAGVSPHAEMVLAREAVDGEHLAALLILRELMHHLDVASIEVQTS